MARKFIKKHAARRRKTEDVQVLNSWMYGILIKLTERFRNNITK
jgi:hypothetical protein